MHRILLEESVPKVREVVATWRVYQVGHRDRSVTGPSVGHTLPGLSFCP